MFAVAVVIWVERKSEKHAPPDEQPFSFPSRFPFFLWGLYMGSVQAERVPSV